MPNHKINVKYIYAFETGSHYWLYRASKQTCKKIYISYLVHCC